MAVTVRRSRTDAVGEPIGPEGRAVVDVVARLIGRASLPCQSGASSLAALGIEEVVVIRCVGREFFTRVSMARIFLRRSEEVIAEGGSELVPLLHEGGIEMLAVTRSMPITITGVVSGTRVEGALRAV
ncbi:MAG: hypothetical protein QOK08_248 [Actinomycetota bacterium]|nr:hypothetical protein [Actinomycetota bacterium]MDQ1542610.1 hypothetical protein [Actinomycetota bacterium]